MKRIGIDARFYGSTGKGLGRYTQKLIENLERIDSVNQYFIFLRKENFDDYQPKNPNFTKILADYKWYGFSEQFLFPFMLIRLRLDLVHFPHFNVPLIYRKKIVVTIHDLILIHFPTIKGSTLNPLFYKIKFAAYKIVINSAIRRSKGIIAVSNFTKNDILQNYPGVDPDKILVTYEGCENYCHFSLGNGDKLLKKYGIINPYILYVGNAYPHKNLERLAEAFVERKFTLKDLKLVLVGKDDYFYAKLKKRVSGLGISGVVFPGFVPDNDLDQIYRKAQAFVFPSLYEGFGLPPLEAMSKGVPVMSSEHECMKEILGDCALFTDTRSKSKIADAINRICLDDHLRKGLIKKGYERSSIYDWSKMAKKTMDLYRKLI